MLLHLRLWPDPILSKPTIPVDVFDDELHKFLLDLRETMLLEDGVGLAATQVGDSRRIAVIVDREGKFRDLINPIIADRLREADVTSEYCLSLEGMEFKSIPRSTGIRLKYQDKDGVHQVEEFKGFMARAVQHEIDHLDGRLLIDRLLSTAKPYKHAEFADRIKAAYEKKLKIRNSPMRQEINRRRALLPDARSALLVASVLGSSKP